MPHQISTKRRVQQNPMDGKGERRYSAKVGTATRGAESHDVENFDRMGAPGQPHVDVDPVSVIAKFSTLGEALRQQQKFAEVATEIASIAEMAETTVMQEAGDWFDAHTIKRNMKELNGYSGAFGKIAEELDSLHSQAEALYDDMGNVLNRYFELTGADDAEHGGGEEVPDARTDPEDADHGIDPAVAHAEKVPASEPRTQVAKHIAKNDEDEYEKEAFGDKQAPPFDGPGGNPADDRGREDGHVNPAHLEGPPGDEWPPRRPSREDIDKLTDSVMDRLLQKERGEPSEFRASKTMRTPKVSPEPHNKMTRQKAKELLDRYQPQNMKEVKACLMRGMDEAHR